MSQRLKVRRVGFNGYEQIEIGAGVCKVERVVPPAGEDYAFDAEHWSHRVTVSVSPTGRSVRVWLDGVEVKFSELES